MITAGHERQRRSQWQREITSLGHIRGLGGTLLKDVIIKTEKNEEQEKIKMCQWKILYVDEILKGF